MQFAAAATTEPGKLLPDSVGETSSLRIRGVHGVWWLQGGIRNVWVRVYAVFRIRVPRAPDSIWRDNNYRPGNRNMNDLQQGWDDVGD